jgi:rRNA processing protein Gar1
MFAFEDNMGGVVINISDVRNGGMWEGGWFIQEKTMNIRHQYAETIADFIIKYGYKEILEKSGDDVGVNIIKNIKNAYFLVRPYEKDTHRYYMRTGVNCTEYERKKSKNCWFLSRRCMRYWW